MSMVRRCLGSGLLSLLMLAPCLAAACTLPRSEAVTIVSWKPDPVLDDGRIVRLAGVLIKHMPERPTLGPAVFYPLARGTDRWGRTTGVLSAGEGGFGTSLNVKMVRDGLGLARPADGPSGCFALMVAAESEARGARRGLWSHPDAVLLKATAIDDLRAQEGRFTLVEGTVRSVRQGRRQVFLNFGAFGSERLSVTVPVARLEAFKDAGVDIMALRGERVMLRGVVGPGPSMELSGVDALMRLPSR